MAAYDYKLYFSVVNGLPLAEWMKGAHTDEKRGNFKISFPEYMPPLIVFPACENYELSDHHPMSYGTSKVQNSKTIAVDIAPKTDNGYTQARILYGAPYVVKTRDTGAFVMADVLPLNAGKEMSHKKFERVPLVRPNGMGMPGAPENRFLMPTDSLSVLVGIGHLTLYQGEERKSPEEGMVLHEQYWRRSPNSFALLPGQQKTVVMQQTTGVTEELSTQQELMTSLGVSASGGWGPVSVAISASLSSSSAMSHTRTIQQQSTNQIEDVVANADPINPIVVYYWELVDRYVVLRSRRTNPEERWGGMIESVQSPPIPNVTPPGAKFVSLFSSS